MARYIESVCRLCRRENLKLFLKGERCYTDKCAIERRRMLISELPVDAVRVGSGLFSALPKNVIVLPVLFEEQVKAVIELASLAAYTPSHLAFLDQLTIGQGHPGS